MYCTNCGTPIEEGNVCPRCGQTAKTITKQEEKNSGVVPESTSQRQAEKQENKRNYFMIGCGVLVAVLFFIAAGLVADGGSGIMQIESVGGKTLEEAYYFELGSVYAGYAMALRATGIFFGVNLIHKGAAK